MIKCVYLQFRELLKITEILYMCDVVVLHKQMGEVGSKVKVANMCNLIVIQVENIEVSTHGEIVLKMERKN